MKYKTEYETKNGKTTKVKDGSKKNDVTEHETKPVSPVSNPAKPNEKG